MSLKLKGRHLEMRTGCSGGGSAPTMSFLLFIFADALELKAAHGKTEPKLHRDLAFPLLEAIKSDLKGKDGARDFPGLTDELAAKVVLIEQSRRDDGLADATVVCHEPSGDIQLVLGEFSCLEKALPQPILLHGACREDEEALVEVERTHRAAGARIERAAQLVHSDAFQDFRQGNAPERAHVGHGAIRTYGFGDKGHERTRI